MTRSNVGAVVILVISAILFTSGVIRKMSTSPDKGDAKPLIAVIPKGTASMWWEVVRQGAERASRELGYDMIWTGPEQETDRCQTACSPSPLGHRHLRVGSQ